MGHDSKTSGINSCIHQTLQLMEHLRGLLPTLQADDVQRLGEEQKRIVAAIASVVWEPMHEVEAAFKQATLEGVAVVASSTGVDKYRELVQPHVSEIGLILIALAGIEPDPSALTVVEHNTPVLHILMSGLDFWDYDQGGDEFSRENLEHAERLLYSDFFEPDRWLSNSEILQPIVGEKADNRLNLLLRQRLKELYRSFILGNHFAALALSRSILEYVLIEKSGKLGFDPHRSDGDIKRLSRLIEDAAAALPKLKDAMELVCDGGNMVMHPRKHKSNISSLPSAMRSLALDSITAVRAIVEALYLR